MERRSLKVIPLRDIPEDLDYCTRYRVDAQDLAEAVRRYGILQPPVLVEEKGRMKILSGFRRVLAAKESGLREIEVSFFSPLPEHFTAAVLFNWNQAWTDLDRAWTLRKAVDHFKIDEDTLTEIFLPALGLPAEKHFLELYLSTARLEAEVLNRIAEGVFPFRGAHLIGRFSKEGQRELAECLAAGQWTSNQILKVAEWLYDLTRSAKANVLPFLEEKGLLEVFLKEGPDRRQKSEEFFRRLRKLRFPRVVECEEKFESKKKEFEKGNRDLRLKLPPGCEQEGFFLEAHLRNPKKLEEILARIKERAPYLNSLFDSML